MLLGSDAFNYLDNQSKSSMSLVSIRFNGEQRNFSFNTSSFSKLLTPSGAKIAEQAADDYKRGIRAPVFYNKAPSSVTENEDRYALSDQKLNEIWNKLPQKPVENYCHRSGSGLSKKIPAVGTQNALPT